MAEQIVSPGVFTNENDLSFLPTGIAALGAAIVGPTLKGPAFIPTIISNYNDFVAQFGDLYEESYVPFAVRNYLRNASTVTVVRVLAEGGYSFSNYTAIVVSGSTGQFTVGAILPTTTVGFSTGNNFNKAAITPSTVSVTGSFAITLSGSGITGQTVSASVQPTSNINLNTVFGESPKGAKKGYMYVLFDSFLTDTNLTSSFVLAVTGSNINLSGSTFGAYSAAATPYITSQLIPGQDPAELFSFYTTGDGQDTNTAVKVSIINNNLPGTIGGTNYGTFSIFVRQYTDTDQRPVVLESFTNCNLDPNSPDYIARRIGDQYYTVNADFDVVTNGNYRNISKYVRVEMNANVDNGSAPASYYPFGFESFLQPIPVPQPLPTMSLVTQFTEINGNYSPKAYYGVNYSNTDNANYFRPLASGSVAGNNVNFNLDSSLVHPSASLSDPNSVLAGSRIISASTFSGVDVSTFLKFTVGFQGGFDGADPAVPKFVGSNITATNLFGLNLSSLSAPGGVAYNKALNIISNADQFDINLLVAPGVTFEKHLAVANQMIEVAEDRGDTFAIIDPVVQGSTLAGAIAAVDGLNTSYAATYWPWVKILNPNTNKPTYVPPSVVVPQVIAFSDSVSNEWFAPAGLNRGGIGSAVDVEYKLSKSKRDSLYQANINPIATFPNQGICIWGQKTLQSTSSALDRINVRRLLIALKKFIASSSRYLTFDNNTDETRQKFISVVTPYLQSVQQRQGIYAFRVVMDETNNTPDVIDRNIMYGQIYIQPARAAEFIVLDFNILPTGASFDNV